MVDINTLTSLNVPWLINFSELSWAMNGQAKKKNLITAKSNNVLTREQNKAGVNLEFELDSFILSILSQHFNSLLLLLCLDIF